MPYFEVHTNVKTTPEDKGGGLREASQLIAELLGKPESYVMVSLQSGQDMAFAGTVEPTCYIRLASLGLDENDTKEMSRSISEFIKRSFGVPAGRCYIEFSSPPRHLWGFNGGTFG